MAKYKQHMRAKAMEIICNRGWLSIGILKWFGLGHL